MKASELRIGNIISFCGNFVYVLSVSRSNFLELGYYTDSIGFERHVTDSNLSEIPITEEWLIRFGFTLNVDEWCTGSEDGRLEVYKHTLGSFDILESERGDYRHTEAYNEIKSVHQLQNLYFALIGEELTLPDEARNDKKKIL